MLGTAESEVLVFPNPNEGLLINVNLSAPASSASAKLFDFRGEEIPVGSGLNNSGLEVYPLSPLAKGLYLLEINTGKELHRKKVLVR